MQRVTGDQDDALVQLLNLTRLIGRVRWAGVLLGVAQAVLTSNPVPLLGVAGILLPALVMAAYNVPVAAARRMPPAWAGRLALGALAGDFLVVTAWTLATANDVYSTSYAAYGLVAIEAAVLFRWRGTAAFVAGYALAYAGFYWMRFALFGYPPVLSSVIYRIGIIVLTAIFVGALTEASERRRQRYQMLLQAISEMGEGLVITHAGRLIYCNRAYEVITGYTRDELEALPSLIELAVQDHQPGLTKRLGDRMSGVAVLSQHESQVLHRDGRVVDVESVIRPLPAEGQQRLIAVVRDITERKRAEISLQQSERRAHQAARSDPLTGIANRRAWDEELARAMARSRRDGSMLTVALLDLDNFKSYNDDWGHVRGDELLRAFTERWCEPLREVDLLARHGGDEFALLLPGSSVDDARLVVQRLQAACVALPQFSAGIACWDGAEPAESLIARADAALYSSKRAGPGRVTAIVASDERVQSWSYLIPRMLDGHELNAVYQSIHRLDTLAVVGYEALARPAGFGARASVEQLFDAAKRLGFARDLDWLCRRVAVHGATSLPDDDLLFINVSVHALLDPLHDVDQMQLLMRWADRDPRTIVFEISERDQVADLERLRRVVSAYRREGFRFALDDVGEGHSTLEVLTCANPEFIKIARSLAISVDSQGPRSAVQALVTFAESSGADLVAEGLETDAQVAMVRDLGVLYGQGYGLAPPRAAPEHSRVRLAGLRTA